MVQTDYSTNIHHTLKKNPMKYSDLQEFITCYNPANTFKRVETWSAEEGLRQAQPDKRGLRQAQPDNQAVTLSLLKGPEGRSRKYTDEEIVALVARRGCSIFKCQSINPIYVL